MGGEVRSLHPRGGLSRAEDRENIFGLGNGNGSGKADGEWEKETGSRDGTYITWEKNNNSSSVGGGKGEGRSKKMGGSKKERIGNKEVVES